MFKAISLKRFIRDEYKDELRSNYVACFLENDPTIFKTEREITCKTTGTIKKETKKRR